MVSGWWGRWGWVLDCSYLEKLQCIGCTSSLWWVRQLFPCETGQIKPLKLFMVRLERIPIGYWKWKWKSLSPVRFFVTPWTIARQAPLSMEVSRQEYWRGLPFPSPEHLPSPGIKPWPPASQGDSLPFELQGSLHRKIVIFERLKYSYSLYCTFKLFSCLIWSLRFLYIFLSTYFVPCTG